MSKLIVEKINETWVRLKCEPDIMEELYYEFQFEVPGARYMPAFKNRIWDGKIKLVNKRGKTYLGLVDKLREFCEVRDYEFELVGIEKEKVKPQDVVEFIRTLRLPHTPRDYQYMGVYKALKEKHTIIQSPTGSGKSLQIYCLIKNLIEWDYKKVLLVVPTINLVTQMRGDFKEYAADLEDIDKSVHLIHGGKEKNTDKPIVISTWQSIFRLDVSWFEQFDAVIVDEVHLAKSDSLKGILEKSINAKHKVGFTGSLDNSITHEMMLTALFGSPYRVASTKDLIEKGHLSDISIKCIVFEYPDNITKAFGKIDYRKEIDFIVQHEPRNKFIRNLALSLEGNTLILFNYVEKHGVELERLIKEKAGNRQVFFVHGETDSEDRELVRTLTEKGDNVIIVASLGTFSTGVNIKKLHNVIFAQPTKSVIRVLQSIGRGLRKADGKDKMKLFDLVDKLSRGKHKNHTYNHFVQRLEIYNNEKFEYSIVEAKLSDGKTTINASVA